MKNPEKSFEQHLLPIVVGVIIGLCIPFIIDGCLKVVIPVTKTSYFEECPDHVAGN